MRDSKAKNVAAIRKPKDGMTLLLMALPFLLLVFVFNYIPLFGWVYAFFNYKPGIPLADTSFAGLKYFDLAFTGINGFENALVNSLALSLLGLAVSPLAIVLAVLLNEAGSKRFSRFVQTTTTLPYFISWVIVFSLFFNLFSTEGMVNTLIGKLEFLGIKSVNVLGNEQLTWYFQTAISIWKNLGWSAIIYIAAITGIDKEQYDAASVDGAGRWATIKHVTLPGIMPTFIVLLLLSVANMLNNGLDQYLVFYNPLVASKIEVLDYFVYRIGIAGNDYPLATAIGIAKTIVSITLLFMVNGVSKKVRGEYII